MKKIFLVLLVVLCIHCSIWAQLPSARLDSLIHTTFHKTLRGSSFFSFDDAPPIQYYFVKFVTNQNKQPDRWIAPVNTSLAQFQAFENSFNSLFEVLKTNPKQYPLDANMIYVLPIKFTRVDEVNTQIHISPKRFKEAYEDIIGATESNSKLHGKIVMIEWLDIKVYPPMK
ncbi:hypothetical protein QNI19_35550 [Cytophagaceae bacterium DM2B3-1]|uniref:Uncharacterized protein n=1 Tax=Xanthocytophaga flava TaxID=3048013 RepID=A0ABT7CZB7_9BACT|nr:hypothetical protein [Xanthocytophaga flavus]MDJ1498305.1 hypothetical protein [Xanthocytophaga flavus]